MPPSHLARGYARLLYRLSQPTGGRAGSGRIVLPILRATLPLSLSLSVSLEPRANELLLIIEGRSAIASRVVKSRASSRRDSACTLALVVVLVAGSARNSLLRLASGTALYLPWYAQVDRYILTSTLPRARERVLYPRARARASLRARCVSLARSLARSLVYVQHTLNISSQS
jgi:hypothetical protein